MSYVNEDKFCKDCCHVDEETLKLYKNSDEHRIVCKRNHEPVSIISNVTGKVLTMHAHIDFCKYERDLGFCKGQFFEQK